MCMAFLIVGSMQNLIIATPEPRRGLSTPVGNVRYLDKMAVIDVTFRNKLHFLQTGTR